MYKILVMLPKILVLFLLMEIAISDADTFIYNGFRGGPKLHIDGIAEITSNGLLRLTNTTKQEKGHAFYPVPQEFKNSPNGKPLSFSTTFVFAIVSEYPELSGHGIVFVISPSEEFPGALANHFLGLFDSSNSGNKSNHILAVELDTIFSSEFNDINDNHVGIDVNGLNSIQSSPTAYFTNDNGGFKNLSLISEEPMQVWVEYDGADMQLNVTISPINVPKPNHPLLTSTIDLSSVISESMYVGFSSSTGSVPTSHYIMGWSFSLNGRAQVLDLSSLPSLPRKGPKEKPKVLTIGLPLILAAITLTGIACLIFTVLRKRKYSELLEDWELEFGPHRFSYKDLFIATKGFRDKELLGIGGFGRVYRGILPTSKIEIAVKKISHESRQGMREFVAEIVSIGRLRHRNLVQLLGYCRRKGELLLVYDYMPNGSLDKLLFNQPNSTLNWSQRYRIIKGVASGLFYLHEEWEQVVIHRDIKASNVLLDGDLNGRLGDFGLARLSDHGTDPPTTHVVGTLGYIAPELTRTGKATTSTDVFAFGIFMLEVACGRRPLDLSAPVDVLIDWVLQCWKRGAILEAMDPTVKSSCAMEEVELVLKLGLFCAHPLSSARPSMREVMQFLESNAPLPDLPILDSSALEMERGLGFDDFVVYYSSSMNNAFSRSSSAAESLLSGGR